jgi:hypothetical protein
MTKCAALGKIFHQTFIRIALGAIFEMLAGAMWISG